MKSLTTVDYLAWAVIIGSGLTITSLAFGVASIAVLSGPLAISIAIVRVVVFLYPLAVFQSRIKMASYAFLNKTVHYIALPLCLFMWLGMFVEM